LGVDATPNLLTFGRRTTAALKAALEIDVGALSYATCRVVADHTRAN
jgi:hypothetical protein